jgi:dTDP-4-dehydrorhamnose reductase
MRITITGSDGKLGHSLHEVLSKTHPVSLLGDETDITNFAFLREAVQATQPDLVINVAAWTDVDGCAREPEKALLINGLGAQNVALAAASSQAAVLHVSSNEVFDGQSQQPYNEFAPCRPISPYGYSKWAGEQGVMQANPRHYIVRTAWLFAHGGKNFIHAILNAANAGKTLRVVIDEVANPTYNNDLAEAIAALIETERYGTYHLVNSGAVSRYQFARTILDTVGMTDYPIERITRAEWPRPSTPPAYAALQNNAAASVGITLRPWQEALEAFLEAEKQNKS